MSATGSAKRDALLLVAGLVGIEFALFGPSLIGLRILAPTDLLVVPGQLGVDEQHASRQIDNRLLLDPVEAFYPWMVFVASEIRAGRLPLWNPYSFCGSPLMANSQSAVFSPFSALFYLWPNPHVLAWIQLVKALVAGTGTYLFLRRIGVSGWGSMVAAWCFPICGFLVAWLNYPLSSVGVWLPWCFWAAEWLVERPGARTAAAAAAAIALTIFSGHLETAAHVLSAAGLYGVWRWLELHRATTPTRRAQILAVGLAATILGLALAAVQLLPSAEYLQTTLRIEARRQGLIDTVLPWSDSAPESLRILFPYLLGTWQDGTVPIGSVNFNEGGTNAYVGFAMIATLVPLGVVRGRRTLSTWFFAGLALVALAPMFQIPLLSAWTSLPPFYLMNNNRALFIAAWCFLVLGARGLDAVRTMDRPPVRWAMASALVPGVCCVVFLWVALSNPARLVDWLAQDWPWYRAWLLGYSAITAATCLALLACLSPRMSGFARAVLLSGIAVAELVISARGYNPQVEAATFYPPRDFIRYMQEGVGDGRVTGRPGTLSANISTVYALRDVRGYDAADPAEYVRLLRAANPLWNPQPGHGVTASFPAMPSPLLDLLSVRFLASPTLLNTHWEHVAVLDGLQLYRNPNALPRAFIPQRIVRVTDPDRRLRMLRNPSFDPRQIAVISEPGVTRMKPTFGSVRFVLDKPCRVVLEVDAQSDAFVVLSDSWSAGWTVTVDGRHAEPLHANHALRAVEVPAGKHIVEWRYFPNSVRYGFVIGAVAAMTMLLWACVERLFCSFLRPRQDM